MESIRQVFERIKGIKLQRADNTDKLIALPVKCFCCWDSGLVRIPSEIRNHLIEGEQDKPFICQRINCSAGQKYLAAYNASDEERKAAKSPLTRAEYQAIFDVRLNSAVCEAIHRYQLDLWVKARQTGIGDQDQEF
jgi:hypothetical protein